MAKRNTFVGLDVHKDSIVVAIAESGRFGEVREYGTVGGELEALDKVLRALRAPRAHAACRVRSGPVWLHDLPTSHAAGRGLRRGESLDDP